VQTIVAIKLPKGSDNKTLHNRLLATLTSMEECGQTKLTKAKEPKRCPKSGTRSIKRAFKHIKTTLQVVFAYPDYLKSLRVTQMLPAINLEQ
jgi:hypothetical protein